MLPNGIYRIKVLNPLESKMEKKESFRGSKGDTEEDRRRGGGGLTPWLFRCARKSLAEKNLAEL